MSLVDALYVYVEARVPKVKASTGSEADSEPETDGELGWRSDCPGPYFKITTLQYYFSLASVIDVLFFQIGFSVGYENDSK